MENREKISFYIDKDLKKNLELMIKSKNISVDNLLNNILQKYIDDENSCKNRKWCDDEPSEYYEMTEEEIEEYELEKEIYESLSYEDIKDGNY